MTISLIHKAMEPIVSRDKVKELVRVNPQVSKFSERLIHILLDSSAIYAGHFELLGGQHSSRFLRFSKIAGRPAYVEEIAKELLRLIKEKGLLPEAIVSRDRSGHLLAWEIGRQAGIKEIIVGRTALDRRPIELVNGVDVHRGSKVLIIDDLITSGAGVLKLKELVEARGATVIGVAVFAVRENPAVSSLPLDPLRLAELLVGQYTFGLPHRALDPDECKLCQEGVPVVRSRDLA